jgi:hypothetical protein
VADMYDKDDFFANAVLLAQIVFVYAFADANCFKMKPNNFSRRDFKQYYNQNLITKQTGL